MTVINTNVKSLIAQASLAANNKNLSTAMERLSTGSRINSAKDDAAGLAISSRMTSQVRGLNMAIRNANDGISLAQTAEGAMEETTSMLQRMRELSLQAANSVNNASDRAALDAEVQQLKTEIDRIATTTAFNGQKILDGSFSGKLQIGAQASETMDLAISSISTTAMGETVSGLGQAATKASLVVGGASRSAGDYAGVSFVASINGVDRTVTLPLAGTAGATPASTSIAAVGADYAFDNSTSAQIGAIDQRTVTFSTTDSGESFKIAVNGGTTQTITLGLTNSTAYTGDQIVTEIQAKLDANAAFQGANALTVSLTDNGQLNVALASGASGTITMSSASVADKASSIFAKLGGMPVGETSTTGSLTVGSGDRLLDFTGKTSFKVLDTSLTSTGTPVALDLSARITANGYDASAMTAAEFVVAYNETIAASVADATAGSLSIAADQAVASVAADGSIVFTVPGATDYFALKGSGTASTDMLAVLGIADLAQATTTAAVALTVDVTKADKQIFGDASTTVTAASNDTLTLAVNGGTAVNVQVQAGTYASMAELAAQVQSDIDATGAFTGENAITVSATRDANGKNGLTFSNANNLEMAVSGNFITGALSATSQASVGNLQNSSGAFTIKPYDYPSSVGTQNQRTVNISGKTGFETTVNGISATLDVGAAVTARGYTITAMSGQQLVDVINDTFAANASFSGVNAVTASLGQNGVIQLDVAGGINGATPSISISNQYSSGTTIASTGFVTTLTSPNSQTGIANAAVNSVNGHLELRGTGTNLNGEYFGTVDFTVGANNDTLNVKLGDGATTTLTLTQATYTDMNNVAAQIQSQLNASGNFSGDSAITVGVATAANGAQSLTFDSANGAAVTLSGNFMSYTTSAWSTAAAATSSALVVIPATRNATGGVDLSANNNVTLSVTNPEGVSSTRTFALGGSDAHTSFAEYASLLEAGANAAFANDGVSFVASYAGGSFTFGTVESGGYTLALSGGSVDSALGGAVSAAGTAGSGFQSLADVAVAINEDLGGAASASFDEATGAWTFAVNDGAAGSASAISLTGAGLAAVQIAGTLSANGSAGTATAAKLSDIVVSTVDGANSAIASIDNAIEYVNSQRATLGAIQNRLDHTVSNLTNIATNTEASRSRIMDADYGAESANLAKAQIIQQAATAMLAQANQSAQSVLSLLQ